MEAEIQTGPGRSLEEGKRLLPALGHPVKVTALEYLKEALQKEHYEVCWDMVTIAQEFGASNAEIWWVINRYARYSASTELR